MASNPVPETVTDYRNLLINVGLWDASDERDPSLSIDAAWQVVEHMHASGWGLAHVMCWPLSSAGRGHNVQFYKAVYPPQYGEGRWEEGDKGQSFPLAICRAALHAVGYSPERADAKKEPPAI